MLNNRTLVVIKREIREKLLSKSFIIATLLIPVMMFGMIALQTVFIKMEGDENTFLQVAVPDANFAEKLQKEFDQRDFVKDGSYQIRVVVSDTSTFEELLKNAKPDMLSGKLSGIVQVPPTATIDKKLKYYSTNPNSRSVEGKITSAVNSVLIDNYFSSKELSQGDLNYAMSRVNMDGFRITEDEKIEEEGVGNRILSFLFAFLLYFSLLFTGQSMITSVLEEKSSRIVEVILASVSTSELMAGKILGSALIGVVQMAIWLSPVLVIISTSIFVLPPELILSITAGHLLYFLVNFLVGLVLFLGLYATLGAIFDNPQDAQSGNLPIMMLIIIPFFITFSMVNNPNNTLATVSSMFPFSSIIVMPSRMTLVDVPLWQFAVSIFLNIAVMFLIFPFAGKIYRVGILRTGKKPSWAEVAKWLRYKN